MTRLYKYVSPTTGRIVLESKTLRWSTPPLLNDPFDMQFAFQLRIDRDVVKTKALRKLYDAYYGPRQGGTRNELGLIIEAFRGIFPQMSREEFDGQFRDCLDESIDRVIERCPAHADEIREMFLNDKILCVSEIPNSNIMWAYYADAPCFDSPWRTARPVRYVNSIPSLFDEESLSDTLSGKGRNVSRVMDTVAFTKSKHWEHEREWRIYSGRGRTRGPHEDIGFYAMELNTVILGCRMSQEERVRTVELVRRGYPAAAFLQATPRKELTNWPLFRSDECAMWRPNLGFRHRSTQANLGEMRRKRDGRPTKTELRQRRQRSSADRRDHRPVLR